MDLEMNPRIPFKNETGNELMVGNENELQKWKWKPFWKWTGNEPRNHFGNELKKNCGNELPQQLKPKTNKHYTHKEDI